MGSIFRDENSFVFCGEFVQEQLHKTAMLNMEKIGFMFNYDLN